MIDSPRAVLTSQHRDGDLPILMQLPTTSDVHTSNDLAHVEVTLANDLTLWVSDVAYLDDLDAALQVARTRLVMWQQDHPDQTAREATQS